MADKKIQIERRRHPRIKKSLPVKAFGESFDFVTETTDISIGGTLCSLDKELPPMTKLELTLLLPAISGKRASRIDCKGIVLRSQENRDSDDKRKFSIAIVFSDLKPADKKKIARYVNRHLKTLARV